MGIHQHNHAFLHGMNKRDWLWDDKNSRFVHIAGKYEDNKDNFINNGVKDSVPTDAPQGNVVTVVSHITVTEPKTFPGPAVYVTKTDVVEVKPTQNSYESMKSAHHANTHNSYEDAKSKAQQPHHRSSNAPSSPTVVKGNPLSVSGSSNPEISQESHGMSSGAKAGLAIGIIAAIGLVAGLILFCVRRRKKQTAERGEKLDEKHASQTSFFSGTAAAMGAPAGDKRASVKSFTSTHSASTAPRLSLRPVTQFLPSILEGRRSTGNNNLSVPAMSEKPRSASPQNPFVDRSASPSNPFDEGDGKGPSTPNHSAKPSWESGDAGTPKVGTATTVAVAGAAPRSGSNNVHRVQLEFKPSMDDELELKSGQLVRMLHEYDDGWALCIRMDRTQQGVCPRTCLSKLPVKPRPQGQPSSGAQGRTSPAGHRGPPPQGPNMMMPRPLTPTGRERSSTGGGRSVSPGAQANRNRSQSVSATGERSVSPIDTSVPARKPVPGQAI